LVSQYYYHCRQENLEIAPLIFTFTPCGSVATLKLIEWLGVSVPVWVRNEIEYAGADGERAALEMSLDLCVDAVRDIARFCLTKGIPFGCNVESVSIRKNEVMASFELVKRVEAVLIELGLR
jgi:hypothetical protein